MLPEIPSQSERESLGTAELSHVFLQQIPVAHAKNFSLSCQSRPKDWSASGITQQILRTCSGLTRQAMWARFSDSFQLPENVLARAHQGALSTSSPTWVLIRSNPFPFNLLLTSDPCSLIVSSSTKQ